jgi:hypothetical protein
MTGEYTEDKIRISANEKRPLVDIEEREHDFVLGGIKLSKRFPQFGYGFNSPLSYDSRFRTQPFTFASGTRAVAVIFRGWDVGRDTRQPEEWLCGWVPEARHAEATRWIKFLNQELRWRLVEKREREDEQNGGTGGGNGGTGEQS